MCNKEVELECPQQEQQQHQAVYLMDSPTLTLGSAPCSNDENPRVKFLCSFSGSILPRPQDGKLRYVGGETRIVSVPRDISYEELMKKMRELFEGATILKYQQPDEDLDALVSVVNDDDVTNMMEEYDKLGSGDGFTRLRIFLFSHPDQDASLHFGDVDERDTERRYVDALNSLNESPEYRKQSNNESHFTGQLDDVHVAEQYFNQMSLEGSLHSQRNSDVTLPPMNLRHLTIPHLGLVQPQQSVSQRYNEMEAPWSPAYYSPRQHGPHDPRLAGDFPISPSSSRYYSPYGELLDKNYDRIPDEYNRHQITHQTIYEHQPQYADNVMCYSNGPVPVDKASFPGNILHGPNVYDGNSICEHCRSTFHRNQVYQDSHWKPGEQSHLEPPSIVTGVPQVATVCAECPPNREGFTLNTDANMHPSYHVRDQTDPRPGYNEARNPERSWVLHHQSSYRGEEPRPHVSAAGRLSDHYTVDSGVNVAVGHANMSEGHHVPSHVHHEDLRHIRGGQDFGSQVFQDQVATGSLIHIPSVDDRGVRYSNPSYAYGADTMYQVPHGHVPGHTMWRNSHNPVQGFLPYEASGSSHMVNGTLGPGIIRSAVESSPRLQAGVENRSPWAESSQKIVGFDGSPGPEYTHAQAVKFTPNSLGQENQLICPSEVVLHPSERQSFATPDRIVNSNSISVVNDKMVSFTNIGGNSRDNSDVIGLAKDGRSVPLEGTEQILEAKLNDSNISSFVLADQSKAPNHVQPPKLASSNCPETAERSVGIVKKEENSGSAPNGKEVLVERLSFLPDLIASVKRAALESVNEVNTKAREDAASTVEHDATGEDVRADLDAVEAKGYSGMGSDNDNNGNSKIEPTKAEEEAIEKGLQTIKNEDLEEIRALGSGTYGAVYHGKWKGSDVAIKRIKASCFAGRPSERERLIADFWKEALILSSLLHPNVVSFYGVVRDGPDGSLATVTEFMVNGSLKQFLQKKDRTIDRRKRLIIAMDAAFGMEYLHAKNIVHFDLKCENLLVNMRDPHRPVCKIGDLGLSKVKQHTLVSGGVRGTLPWMAPELLSGKSNMVTEKIDVYSFGIVMWELLTGDEPYADMHCASIIGGIVNNTLRPQIPTWCDPEWKSLMESCWSSDPAQRPSFSDISQKLRSMAAAMNLK